MILSSNHQLRQMLGLLSRWFSRVLHLLLKQVSTQAINVRSHCIFFLFTVITMCTWPHAHTVRLTCTDPLKLYITNVTWGQSACPGQVCCPNNTVCTNEAHPQHFQYVQKQCDGKQTCLTEFVPGTCEGPNGDSSDYESVHYVCTSTYTSELTMQRFFS